MSTQLAINENYDGPGVPRYHEAYNRHLAAILAVPEQDLIQISVDLRKVLTNTLGVLPKLVALRDQLESPQYLGPGALDNLEGYLLAMAHGHALHEFASQRNEIAGAAEMATQVREVLLADTRALVQRGLISGAGLENLKGPRGYRNVAFDLISLTAVMRQNWATIEGRTALRLEELDRAEALADQVLISVGLRDQGPPEVEASAIIRQKAFTLFVRTYDEVRRAVSFLRWHEGDADEIAPSLYAGRTRRRAPGEPAGSLDGSDVITPPPVDDQLLAVAALPAADLPPSLPNELPETSPQDDG